MRSFNSLGLWDLVLRELDIEEVEGRERSRETGWTLLSGLDSSPPPAQLAGLCLVCSLRVEAASSLITPFFSPAPQPACPELFAPRCLLGADFSAWGHSPSLTPTHAYRTFFQEAFSDPQEQVRPPDFSHFTLYLSFVTLMYCFLSTQALFKVLSL